MSERDDWHSEAYYIADAMADVELEAHGRTQEYLRLIKIVVDLHFRDCVVWLKKYFESIPEAPYNPYGLYLHSIIRPDNTIDNSYYERKAEREKEL